MTEASSVLRPLDLDLSGAGKPTEWDLSQTQITELLSGYNSELKKSPITANTAPHQNSLLSRKRASEHKHRQSMATIDEALKNHKEGIEQTYKVSQHLQARMSDVADILREHSENHRNLQHRVQILEELVLQLSKNSNKNQKAFCATNQPLARDA